MPAPPENLDPAAMALFLDVDGTLLAIEEHPDDVAADDELRGLLGVTAERFGGALALVSGRRIVDLDRIFAPLELPAAGGHGAELRFARGDAADSSSLELPGPAMQELTNFAARYDGLLLEVKPNGVSLHYRGAPGLRDRCRDAISRALALAGDDFRVIEGKMVFEIAPRICHKGSAIARFLEQPPFCGRRPVFVGDDVTDEDGFVTVLDAGGIAVRVGDAETAAPFTLDDCGAVRRWLRTVLEMQAA